MLSGILGSLLGFGGSVVPAITDHFKTKSEQKFELQKMEKMAELRKAGFDHEMRMFEQQASDKEHERLIQHDISINQGTGFIAGLQKSVRPVITYCFFGLFAAIENCHTTTIIAINMDSAPCHGLMRVINGQVMCMIYDSNMHSK